MNRKIHNEPLSSFTLAEKAFFKLLRLAVDDANDDVDVQLDALGWKVVYEMSCKQALTAVVLDGVERLPADRKPPKTVLMPWISVVQQIEVTNRRLNHVAVKVCEKFRSEGMSGVVLKGQGNAVLYPRPLHRMPGDIDLWLDCDRKTLVAYVRRYCPHVEVVYHHVDFPVMKETEIELHFTPSWMNCLWSNLRLQRQFRLWKEESLAHRVVLPEGAGEISVPSLAMNRVYLLLHIYRHLFDEGIGLRQLLDYYYILRQPCTESECEETLRVLGCLRMKRFAAAVMYVMQTVFGLQDDYLLLPPCEKRGQRLLQEIMLAGNFGQHDERIHRSVGETSLERFFRKVGRNLMFLADYPSEVLWSPLFKMWHYSWRATHGYFAKKR